jgi:sugar (pentulose or hexulose) kinase
MGIDVGSSNCKVLVVDRQGRVVAYIPRPGWAGQSPEDGYLTTCLHLNMESNNV